MGDKCVVQFSELYLQKLHDYELPCLKLPYKTLVKYNKFCGHSETEDENV